ncbi:MAG TPA: polysaccharide biosynthesis tyrosine autokinase [Thermoanaerobaculia bacterium]|jgi:succinoglycan biosynthesis transport protein ExoP|nr:polysaccharide biosynthesis tyrosine autokinase [Thermoanaerobaculia bacterium]
MDLNTQEVHLSHYWNIIYKRWKVAVSILAVVMLGTFLASHFAKPLYRSAIEIQIERENPNQLTVDDLFGIAASDQEFLQTQYVLLKSRGLAERVIDDQKLLSDADFYPPGITGKTQAQIADIRASMAGAITGTLEVTPVRNTSLVDVMYISSTPRLAQKIVEAVGESYIRLNNEKKFESVKQTSEFLDRQVAQIRADIDVTRKELQQFGENKGLVSSADASSIPFQKLMKLNGDVQNATSLRLEKQNAYDSLSRANPESVTSGDPLVSQLTEEESRKQRDYSQGLGTFKPDYPQMIAMKNSIDKTHQARMSAIAAAFARLRDAAHRDLLAAQQTEDQMYAAMIAQKRETMSLSTAAAGFSDLTRTLESKQSLLDQLEKRQNETEVTARLRGSASSNIHFVDHAQLPTSRFNVSLRQNLQNAFPLGVVLGLAAIFFLEYMDRSIKTPEELERVTKFASLGVIPAASSAGRGGYGYGGYGYGGYGRGTAKLRPVVEQGQEQTGIDLLPHSDTRSAIAEAYRAFRTSLLLASASSPKVIVISSTFAREGKTTTSVNLATVLAQMGKPVLLIDADLRRPRLQKVFRGKMNLGLVNYLAANIPLDDVIQETQVPNLSLILSGPTPPNPSELLGSDRMKHLIHEIRAKYAFVIFDSPPVMAVTDSIVLAANADGVVLCVHGGQTPRDIVQRAAERLRQSNIPVLGAILNNLDLHQYGYSFKKSYYDYYSDESPDKDKKDAPARRVG